MDDNQLKKPQLPLSEALGRSASNMPPGVRLKTLAVATSIALYCLPGITPAHAQSIGALDVRSRLGEPFFAAVPVKTNARFLDPGCIRVVPNPNAPQGAEALPRTHIRIGSADSVIIQTAAAVTSPIVGLRLEVGCENPVSRDFVVLGDAPDVSGTVAQPPARAATPSVPATATQSGRVAASARRAAPRPKAAVAPVPTGNRSTVPARTSIAAPPEAPMPAMPAVPRRAPVTAKSAAVGVGVTPTAANTGPGGSGIQSDNARRLSELQARSDDQAAAMLALEDRLALLQKQAELLKLQLEQALAGAPAAGQGTAAGAGAPAAASQAPTAKPVVSGIVPTAAKATTSDVPALVQPSPRKEPGLLDVLFDWRIGAGLAILVLGALAFKLKRRPVLESDRSNTRVRSQPQTRPMTPLDPDQDPSMFEKTGEYPVMSSFAQDKTAEWPSALQPPAQRTAEWIATPAPETDNFPVPEPGMTTSQIMRANPAALSREFHITQQFQPDAERVVALSAPEEIVLQARTHYMDDGDVFRAIDLLEMAVSVRKDSPRPWQALFAIYRRENMPERFQRLVLAYRSAFGEDDNWLAIQALGRQMDPENRLYAAAAESTPLPDDLLERWLGVPLDFTAHLLANEMHDQLMSTNPGRKRRRSSAQ